MAQRDLTLLSLVGGGRAGLTLLVAWRMNLWDGNADLAAFDRPGAPAWRCSWGSPAWGLRPMAAGTSDAQTLHIPCA